MSVYTLKINPSLALLSYVSQRADWNLTHLFNRMKLVSVTKCVDMSVIQSSTG